MPHTRKMELEFLFRCEMHDYDLTIGLNYVLVLIFYIRPFLNI